MPVTDAEWREPGFLGLGRPGKEGAVMLAMTKQERERFLAEIHVGIIGIPEDGRGPLAVPVWYAYTPAGELRVVTGRTSRKGRLLQRAGRFSLCAQTETPPYRYVSVEGPIIAIEAERWLTVDFGKSDGSS
jgi:nitroimidazol reductase NimA-like FMN-containing flavoprotein (pyridoxamine 5'-phosphate oxidase superfamily)